LAILPRIQPLQAWASLQSLLADPDDTEQAFRAIASLSGNSSTRLFRRFRRTHQGAELLEQPLDALRDRLGIDEPPDYEPLRSAAAQKVAVSA